VYLRFCYYAPRHRGRALPPPPPQGGGIKRYRDPPDCLTVRMSVSCPRRAAASGYRHAGCLQLSHRRPPEMCGLRTRPRTDVDPPRVELPSAGEYRLAAAPPGGAIVRCLVIPAKARDYVFAGVGLSVCLFVCLFVCYHDN